MSDITIIPSIDTSEIDAAIAKLEGALEKTGQLTSGTASPEQGEFYTIPNSEMEQLNQPYMQTPDLGGFYDNLDRQAEAAKKKADDLISTEGEEIKGLESASSRVIRMIPGLREAQRLKNSLGQISAGNITGVIGLLMLAYSIYRQISAMLEEQKQQQADYQKAVMEVRGLTTSAQFTSWKEGQRQTFEGYRTNIIP